MQETSVVYREGPSSTITHESENFFVDILLELAKMKPMRDFPISRLDWVLNGVELNQARVEAAKTVYPLIVCYDRRRFLEDLHSCRLLPVITLDGIHRLKKAIQQGRTKVKVRFIELEDIREAHYNPNEFTKYHKLLTGRKENV